MMRQWGKQNVPLEVQQDLVEMFPGLSVEEVLQDQASLYQSLKTSSSIGRHSLSSSGEYDLELAEALARSRMELDTGGYYEVNRVSHSETAHITPSTSRQVAGGTSIPAASQDDINPDEMTYEELQSLGEATGIESKGLSESMISLLRCHKYKAAGCFFNKKVRIEECAICYEGYKNKESVTTLPCEHQYHKKCINDWLLLNKSCPICKKEVACLESEIHPHCCCNFHSCFFTRHGT